MKVLWTLIACVLLSTGCAGLRGPRDPWTKTDTALQVTYSALHVMDWSQTLHLARNPDKYSDGSIILGGEPSTGRVNSYFAITLIGHAAISYALPKPERTWWQGLGIAVEAYCVHHNHYAVGVKVSF